MEQQIKELFYKCYTNGLSFNSTMNINNRADEIDIFCLDKNGRVQKVAREFIRGFGDPMEAMERLHEAVDEFIGIEQMEDTEFVTDRTQGVSSDEWKMKDAGHKLSDFY